MIQNIIYNSLIICLNFDLNFAKCWICDWILRSDLREFCQKKQSQKQSKCKKQIKSKEVKKASNKVWRSVKSARKAKIRKNQKSGFVDFACRFWWFVLIVCPK